MPGPDFYVNGLNKTLAESILEMGRFNASYVADLAADPDVLAWAKGVDLNAMSIPEIKNRVRSIVDSKLAGDIDHFGRLPITGKDGKTRFYNPDSWSEMEARTVSRQMQEEGLHNEMKEVGIDLVIVSIGGSGDKCKDFEGCVLSVSGNTPGYMTVEEAKTIHLWHPNCFTDKNVLISTEDGLCPIENISIGQKVYTHTGALQSVTGVIRGRTKNTPVVQLSTEIKGDAPVMTCEHPVFIHSDCEYAWRAVKDVRIGDCLAYVGADDDYSLDKVERMLYWIWPDGEVTYNLSVYKDESYVAGGLIVHNCVHTSSPFIIAGGEEQEVWGRDELPPQTRAQLKTAGAMTVLPKGSVGSIKGAEKVKEIPTTEPPGEEMVTPWLSAKDARALMPDETEWARVFDRNVSYYDLTPQGATLRNAVREWTGGNYGLMRKIETSYYEGLTSLDLRTKVFKNMDSRSLVRTQKNVDRLESMLHSGPKYKGSVARGTNTEINLVPGDTFELRAMASFSSGSAPVSGWASNRSILIVENSKKGVDISKISSSISEREVLMPKGAYRVKEVIERPETFGMKQKIFILEEI